jgi:hypothetical protein
MIGALTMFGVGVYMSVINEGGAAAGGGEVRFRFLSLLGFRRAAFSDPLMAGRLFA